MKRTALFLLFMTAVAFIPSRPVFATCSCQNADNSWEDLADSDALTTAAQCRDACIKEEGKDYTDGTTTGLAAEEVANEDRRAEVKARAQDFSKNGLCQCYCGDTTSGAQPVGSGYKTTQDCKTACDDASKKYVSCAQTAQQSPLADPVCWGSEECAKQKGLWDTENQPFQCEPNKRYCYPPPESISLNVHIGATTEVSDIGTYINAFYSYGLGAAALIAIVLIMVGGAQYILGSGIGSVEAGKKRIGNAVTGLVILLGAYLLLNTINPYLVNWKTIKLPKIKPALFVQGSCNNYSDQGYIVEPVKDGDIYCGNDGIIMTSPDGVQMSTKCVYDACTMKGQFCSNNSGAYSCLSCGEIGVAAQKGLNVTSSLCAAFPASVSGTVTDTCAFIDDQAGIVATAFGLTYDTCWPLTYDCSQITSCQLYARASFVREDGSAAEIRYATDVFKNLCEQNPCSESVTDGPCQFDEQQAAVYATTASELKIPCQSAFASTSQ